MDKIRLACRFCDRDDCDGVRELPFDWFAIEEVQAFEVAIQTAAASNTRTSVFDWYTHLGVCPDCYEVEILPAIPR